MGYRCKILIVLTFISVSFGTQTILGAITYLTLHFSANTYYFNYVSRSNWNARKPTGETPLNTPVPFVVIHHSYIPAACYNFSACVKAMQSMQNYHMDYNHWNDIGYNFGVGSDGTVYEGRGWKLMGAHTRGQNNISIGICLIGDWRTEIPPPVQLLAAKELIEAGISLGVIEKSFSLFGHRDKGNTECPGEALYKEISKWRHFSGGNHTIQY